LDDLDLAPWRAQAIVLPLGMKRAVRAAFMYAPANAARKFVETVEGELTPEGLSVYKECEKTLGRQKVLEDAKIVMLEHIAAHLPLRSAQKSDEPPIMQPQKLAARTRADQSQSVETFI